MTTSMRRLGPDVLGEKPWGAHACMFYESIDDLLDTVVPFFKTGLDNNEFCLWVPSAPLTPEEAAEALRHRLTDFDRHLARGNMEIFPSREWYLKGEGFDLARIMSSLDAKLRGALAKGYPGMRASGDASWINTGYWKAFCDYELTLNKALKRKPVTVLCTYPLMMSGAAEMLEVAQSHQIAIVRRNGDLGLIGAVPAVAKDHAPESDGKSVIGELLSGRERDIINMIAQGQSNKEIARRLGIAPETVKTHVTHIFDKLNVNKRARAVVLAQSLGVLGAQ
jgi:DNA-binding CsgD family transcriptional regulator